MFNVHCCKWTKIEQIMLPSGHTAVTCLVHFLLFLQTLNDFFVKKGFAFFIHVTYNINPPFSKNFHSEELRTRDGRVWARERERIEMEAKKVWSSLPRVRNKSNFADSFSQHFCAKLKEATHKFWDHFII